MAIGGSLTSADAGTAAPVPQRTQYRARCLPDPRRGLPAGREFASNRTDSG